MSSSIDCGGYEMVALRGILPFLRALLGDPAELAVENLALRQQLAISQRTANRAHFRKRDRLFWVWLSRLWSSWRSVLIIVEPNTVVRWHRQGFKFYWRWKLRAK